jgi:hypothetical protein
MSAAAAETNIDPLGHAFGFLSLAELRPMTWISHTWRKAVHRMNGSSSGVLLRNMDAEQRLNGALQSEFARHVISINPPVGLLLSCARVNAIAHQMPFLQTLRFSPLPGQWRDVCLSLTLRTVRLEFTSSGEMANLLLVAFSRLPQLVDLTLEWHNTPLSEHVSFVPLQTNWELKRLRIRNILSRFVPITAAQGIQLRALKQLEVLDCAFDEETLVLLLQPPFNSELQWTALPSGSHISDASVALLRRLPRLQRFNFTVTLSEISRVSSLDFLAELPALRHVDIGAVDYSGDNDWNHSDLLLQTLSVQLQQVTSFRLDRSESMSSEQLRLVLRRFPQLVELQVSSLSRLDSLSFLQSVPTLLRFTCIQCPRLKISMTDLIHLRSCQRITHVTLSSDKINDDWSHFIRHQLRRTLTYFALHS